jgi:8-oxo-dGTP pyrophosphatase MutT (NUDIX family)
LPDAAPERSAKRAVRPRHAASLIIVRQSRQGTELLMGMRGAKHRFMPNILVFPGGRVDAADHRAPFATPLRDDTRALLERSAPPRLAQTLALAAARELEEETGLTLAQAPGAPPALDGLHYLCRAVTPAYMHMRFNARFLVVDAERVSGTLGGSGELEALRYIGLDDALAHDLAGITRGVVLNLQNFLTLGPEERATRAQVPVNERDIWRME